MKNKNAVWLWAFTAAALALVAAEVLHNRTLTLFAKPLLMPMLAIWFAVETGKDRRFWRWPVLAALGFSTAGDTLLMFSQGDTGPLFFLLGLGAFLLAHICYISGFLSRRNLRGGYLRQQPVLILVFILYPILLLWWLWHGIPEGLRLPVALYAAVISTMALTACNLRGAVSARASQYLIWGAALFVLSDSLIAVFKFGQAFAGGSLAIIVTYLTGQYLIVRGVRLALGE